MRVYAEALWGCWRPSATIEAFDPANHYIIERDGVAVGCIAEIWQPDHVFIGKLYVDAPFQRQSIGAVVLEMKSKEACAKGIPIKLSVLTTNPADAFYRREGFEVESETAERRWMLKRWAATAASDSAISSL
ncbi:hypothetical protein AWL63_18915 [Sphingomonas panacis]|uniref:N-acetyltransferase domain-containing protein n=2 Tax=Sphingomonas panacis TaxID=1560345 RepID=A0A1B3ZE48_9SPHN|nr:hypothetical protein AWL63_18915 [Sphingomonas panacis]